MNHYRIPDQNVREALKENGFICNKPENKPNLAPIQFHLQLEPFKPTDWYDTDCPIPWNGYYTLPDGRILVSNGTALAFAEEEK